MVLIFGLGWLVAKDALGLFPPILLACFRFAVTAAVLIGFFSRPPQQFGQAAITSVLAITIPYSMSYVAMRDLDVSSAVLLAQMEAPVLILTGALMLREVPTLRQVLGIAVAVGGVILVAGDPKLGDHMPAVALALGSIATWAVGQIRIRKLGADGGMQTLAWLALFSAPQLLAVSLLLENGQTVALSAAKLEDWLAVVYLGFVMTAVGIGIWYRLIARYPAAQVAPFLLLVPIVSIAGAVLLLNEELDPRQLAGGTLIVLGVAAVIIRKFNRHKAEDEGKALTQ